MTKTQESVLSGSSSQVLVWAGFAILSGVAPLILHQQWITGPLINSILVAATLTLGPWQALTLAFIPSGMALAAGILPLVLSPTVPVIIIGNMLLVAGIQVFKSKPILGIITGSIVKFIWLTAASMWIMQFFIAESFLSKVTSMLSWPQLATALIGGVIALGVLKLCKK